MGCTRRQRSASRVGDVFLLTNISKIGETFLAILSLAIGTWEAADVAMKSIFMQLHLSIVDKTQIAKIAWNRRVNFGDFVMIDFPQMLHQIRFEFEGSAAFFADEGLIVGMTSLVSLSLEHRLEFPTANIADKLKVFRLSLNGLLHLADLVYYA